MKSRNFDKSINLIRKTPYQTPNEHPEYQGTHEEILKFVEENFQASKKITFFEKGDVNGANTRDVFSFLKQKTPNADGTKDVRWNFAKFLVDHEGEPYQRFGSTQPPMAMKEAIEELLRKKEEASSD